MITRNQGIFFQGAKTGQPSAAPGSCTWPSSTASLTPSSAWPSRRPPSSASRHGTLGNMFCSLLAIHDAMHAQFIIRHNFSGLTIPEDTVMWDHAAELKTEKG